MKTISGEKLMLVLEIEGNDVGHQFAALPEMERKA
jgi:hypothetical protein